MKMTFLGAAGEVTGSMTLVDTGKTRVLVDCGMIQGNGNHLRNFEPFPFDAASIDAVIVTHAHIDHIGRIPKPAHECVEAPVAPPKHSPDWGAMQREAKKTAEVRVSSRAEKAET